MTDERDTTEPTDALILRPSTPATSYPPEPYPVLVPPTPLQHTVLRAVQPDIHVLRTLSAPLLASARYPVLRRRERVAYRILWRRRWERLVMGLFAGVGEGIGRVGRWTGDDVREILDLTRAYAPSLFDLMERLPDVYASLLEALPALADAARQHVQTLREGWVVLGDAMEEDLGIMRVMARRYAPGVLDVLLSALRRAYAVLPSVVLVLPPLTPTVAPPHSPPHPVPPDEDEFGVVALDDSPEPPQQGGWNVVLFRGEAMGAGVGLGGAMEEAMPGLEGGSMGDKGS